MNGRSDARFVSSLVQPVRISVRLHPYFEGHSLYFSFMAAAIHTALIRLQQFSVLACPGFDGEPIVLRFVDVRI
jgi:hypothetical protein